jgi:hypothetical protein
MLLPGFWHLACLAMLVGYPDIDSGQLADDFLANIAAGECRDSCRGALSYSSLGLCLGVLVLTTMIICQYSYPALSFFMLLRTSSLPDNFKHRRHWI